jgi:hypothetical protein
VAGRRLADGARHAEETGFAAGEGGALASLGAVHEDTSKNTNRVFCFLAEGVRPAGERRLDPTEAAAEIAVELHPLGEVRGLLGSGEVTAQSSVLTIFNALDVLGRR